MRRQQDFEEDPEAFPAETYTCKRHWPGVALRVLGWEIVSDVYGSVERTGLVVVRMVGDDKHWYVEFKDLEGINEDEYCLECGQIGCAAVKGA